MMGRRYRHSGWKGVLGLAAVLGVALQAAPANAATAYPQERGPGYEQAESAYAKYASRDFSGAAADARQATRLEPNNARYWSLLASSLRDSGDRSGALAALVEQERRFGSSGENALEQAYILAATSSSRAAGRFSAALASADLSADQARAASLAYADVLLSTDQPQLAIDVLGNIDDGSHAVDMRTGAALGSLGLNREAGARFLRAVGSAPDDQGRDFAQRSAVLASLQAGDNAAASELILVAIREGRYGPEAAGQWASLAISAGDDVSAQAFLASTGAANAFTRQSALDAGYSAKRIGLDDRAVGYFSLGLELDRDTIPALSPAERFGLRRDIADLSRVWGASALVSYGANDFSFTGAIPSAGTDTVTQAGGEVYRRIGGYRNGRPVEVFARAFQTLSADPVGASGADTTQGWFGVRWKPFTRANIILEASRLVALGDLARDDWMLRTAFSAGRGLDIQPDVQSWPMLSVYGDLSHIIDADQTLGTVEGRGGWSYRVFDSRPLLVISPFISANLGYDSLAVEEEAIGLGGGLSVRQWVGGDMNAAPSRYVELTVQGRTRVSEADRASGIFVTLSAIF